MNLQNTLHQEIEIRPRDGSEVRPCEAREAFFRGRANTRHANPYADRDRRDRERLEALRRPSVDPAVPPAAVGASADWRRLGKIQTVDDLIRRVQASNPTEAEVRALVKSLERRLVAGRN